MDDLNNLFTRNASWAQRSVERDPDFFKRLVAQQSPKYLWIGCSDSRVPANEIVDLEPGELFVHRNIANVVPLSDINAQSVIQFAVESLQVEHIMVVGHYGCAGVHAALHNKSLGGVSDFWLSQIRAVHDRYSQLLHSIPSQDVRDSLLCELNVIEQALSVCASVPVRAAWKQQRNLTVHGWIYGLSDGLLHRLNCSIDRFTDIDSVRSGVISNLHLHQAMERRKRPVLTVLT